MRPGGYGGAQNVGSRDEVLSGGCAGALMSGVDLSKLGSSAGRHASSRRAAEAQRFMNHASPDGVTHTDKAQDPRAKLEFCPQGTQGKNSGESAYVRAAGAAATPAFQAVTAFVGPEDPDGFMRVVRSEGSGAGEGGQEEEGERVMLIGLHTCGDLGPSLLQLFVNCDGIRSVVVVGCCYHKLTQHPIEGVSFAGAPLASWPVPGWNGRCACGEQGGVRSCASGFPLSRLVRSKRLWLGM